MICVRMGEICVIPRGIRFRVSLPSGLSRGHVIEAFSGHFDVPELGAIGTLGLANVRDFEIPKASYYDTEEITEVMSKFGGKVHTAKMKGSAFNAVSWHGTYYPFKYDLGMTSIGSFDIMQATNRHRKIHADRLNSLRPPSQSRIPYPTGN